MLHKIGSGSNSINLSSNVKLNTRIERTADGARAERKKESVAYLTTLMRTINETSCHRNDIRRVGRKEPADWRFTIHLTDDARNDQERIINEFRSIGGRLTDSYTHDDLNLIALEFKVPGNDISDRLAFGIYPDMKRLAVNYFKLKLRKGIMRREGDFYAFYPTNANMHGYAHLHLRELTGQRLYDMAGNELKQRTINDPTFFDFKIKATPKLHEMLGIKDK